MVNFALEMTKCWNTQPLKSGGGNVQPLGGEKRKSPALKKIEKAFRHWKEKVGRPLGYIKMRGKLPVLKKTNKRIPSPHEVKGQENSAPRRMKRKTPSPWENEAEDMQP